MKKIFLLITIIAIGLLSCGKNETASTETSVSQSGAQNAAQQSQENNGDKSADTADFPDESNEEYPGGMAKGMDQEFAKDGSLHEEQFLNKTFGYKQRIFPKKISWRISRSRKGNACKGTDN